MGNDTKKLLKNIWEPDKVDNFTTYEKMDNSNHLEGYWRLVSHDPPNC